MIDLSPFHPIGYEWLAKCKLADEQTHLAKDLLKSACDKGPIDQIKDGVNSDAISP